MDTNGTMLWSESEAGQQLQARLSSEKTLKALDHLLARIDTLEQAVERLADIMQQGPGLVSMATDSIDETVKVAAAKGIDLEERLANALHLAEQLTSPQMVNQLSQLFAMMEQLPGLSAMAIDMVDEGYRVAASQGISIEQRLTLALQLAERLTQPAVVERLHAVLDLSDQLPGLVAMGVDVLDEGYRNAAEAGLDLGTLSEQGIAVLKQLSTLLSSDAFKHLLQSGLLAPDTVGIVAKAGDALVESQQRPPKKVGLFGLMSALNDADRQRALGFLMDFAKQFGKKLNA